MVEELAGSCTHQDRRTNKELTQHKKVLASNASLLSNTGQGSL